jgi:hypothetical protein
MQSEENKFSLRPVVKVGKIVIFVGWDGYSLVMEPTSSGIL